MERVQVQAVSKRFLLGEQRNLGESLSALVTRRRKESREFWSLRDISFTVADGEALGIVGRNGAGKSTLLKVLTRITTPTRGESRTRGRVAALLEVGTGFHPELTGRENVYLNAAVLGMSRAETSRRFDEILDFAGTEKFLDTPVKRYSSGMYLRLAFAIAAHLDPDILIVDEVLAVGDAEFQRKCLNRMSTAGAEGRTVLFVSHDLGALSRLCTRSIWLEAGRIRDEGDTPRIVKEYLTSGLGGGAATLLHGGSPAGRLRDVRVTAVDGVERPLFREEPIRIAVGFDVREDHMGLDIAFHLQNDQGLRVVDQALSDSQPQRLPVGRYMIEFQVPPVLAQGDYTVGIWLGTPHYDVHYEPAALNFTLHSHETVPRDRAVVLDTPLRLQRLE